MIAICLILFQTCSDMFFDQWYVWTCFGHVMVMFKQVRTCVLNGTMVQHDQTRSWKVMFGHQKPTDLEHIQRYLNYVLVDNCMRIDHVLNMLQHVRNMIKYVMNMTNMFKDHGKSCHVKPSKNNRFKTCLNIFKPYFDGQLDDDNSCTEHVTMW